MDGGGAFSGSTFVSGQTSYGDNIDVIWRQSDVNGDNLWDGTYERDFGIGATTTSTPSGLSLTLNVSAANTVSNPGSKRCAPDPESRWAVWMSSSRPPAWLLHRPWQPCWPKCKPLWWPTATPP